MKFRREFFYAFINLCEMIGIVLSSLSETAFEYKLSPEEIQIFLEELKIALKEYTRKALVKPIRKSLGRLFPSRRRAEAATRNLMALADKFVDSYTNKAGDCENGTIIQLIMESDQFPTKMDKAAQLLEFLVAGHDTTGYT